MSFKQTIKRVVQHVSAALGPHRWPSHDPQLLVLMYHRILPREDPRYLEEQPGMVVEPDTFQMHLKIARQFFEPVCLHEWIQRRAQKKSLPKKAVAITFDDGWRDNYDYAYAHLKNEQVPATIFLVSDLIGTDDTFWPERLMKTVLAAHRHHPADIWQTAEFKWLLELGAQYAFADKPPNRDELDEIVSRAKQFSDEDLHQRLDAMQSFEGLDSQSDNPDILDWTQIKEMTDSGLIKFGSHTRRHVRMTPTLDHTVMAAEIIKSKEILASKTGTNIDLFCYPNGDITAEADKLVRQQYQGACTTNSGWNKSNADAFMLKRIGIHQDIAWDETAFLARLSGWL